MAQSGERPRRTSAVVPLARDKKFHPAFNEPAPAQPQPNIQSVRVDYQSAVSSDLLRMERKPNAQLQQASPCQIDRPAKDVKVTFDTEIPALPTIRRKVDGATPTQPSRGTRRPDLEQYSSPFKWPSTRKFVVLSGPMLCALMATYGAGSYAMATSALMKKWDLSQVAANVGITVYVLGFAISPIILAPYSEAKGRYWVFVGGGVAFFLGTLGCAVTQSYAGMLVCRFIAGAASATFGTLVGGVVSDMYDKEERNASMTLFSFAQIAGAGFGPLCSGIISDRLSWRWIFYVQVIVLGTLTLAIFISFRETRSSIILQRKARALNAYLDSLHQEKEQTELCPKDEKDGEKTQGKTEFSDLFWSGSIRFLTAAEQRRSLPAMIWASFKFPLRLLATESIVFWFSLWAAFAWTILYMQFNSITLVFKATYGFTNTQIGAVFTAVIVGAIIVAYLSIYQDKYARRYWQKAVSTPEGRLYFACIESAGLPIGLLWFGWTSSPAIHWIVPTIAIAVCTIGVFSISLAVFNYLADSYHRYASSALAAQALCRNVLASIFPLITNRMFRTLTNAGAGSLLGGLGILLTAVPWILCCFGHKIRKRSPLAREIME